MSRTIQQLRRLMRENGIQAYLIPSSDPHQSEYVPEFWQRRKFISGFSGSAGDAVVTLKEAGLWTDSRYFLQAEQQLAGSRFTLFKLGMPDVPTIKAWVSKKLKQGQALGVDPQVISHREFMDLKAELETRGIRLTCVKENLVDAVWDERPAPPKGKAELHSTKYAGESVASKLSRLRAKMAEEKVGAHILTMLDSIAWLFNIRGQDVAFNPVVISYAVVTPEKALLFIDSEKISVKIRQAFKDTVELRPYEDFEAELVSLWKKKVRVWVDSSTVSQWVVEMLKDGARLLLKPSPVLMFKALKNKAQVKGLQQAHLRDGVAMVKFLHWLAQAIGKTRVTELSAAEKAREFRSQGELFKGMSFQTISSYAEHGAVVHYAVTPETDIPLKPRGIYIIDSGAQYLDGTTDITRTIAMGKPTAEQKNNFTRVLRGMIDLFLTSFPQGTAGRQLDTIAREPLWEVGLNFGHGTGHGVGFFLNVHEGPQAISFTRCTGIGLEPGMVTTIEPGYYRENAYGMRVENMAVVVRDEEKSSPELAFFIFETLTLCPIDLRLVNKILMTEREIKWLNDYHRRVYRVLSPFLSKPEAVWLRTATQAI